MNGSTLNTDELDALLLVSGILHANPETRSLSHTLLDIVKRQRALGTVPTVSAQQVADRVGDPALRQRFAPTDADNAHWQREAERIGMPELGKLCPKLQQRAQQFTDHNVPNLDPREQPNEDDRRHGSMLPKTFRFRVAHGKPENVFEARRTPTGVYLVQWLTGKVGGFTPAHVAMLLRLDRWRPTHDPITVGGAT